MKDAVDIRRNHLTKSILDTLIEKVNELVNNIYISSSTISVVSGFRALLHPRTG